jgi:hypothetical protein
VIGLDCIRQLKQFLLGGLRRRERTLVLEFHLGCMIAMPMASAGSLPLGPRGIWLPSFTYESVIQITSYPAVISMPGMNASAIAANGG